MAELRVQKSAALEIQFFGSFSLRIQGESPHLRARAEQYLLTLLALRREEALERKWLAVTLWPDSAEDKALFNLRRNLTDLRRVLASEAPRLYSPTPRTLRFDFSDAVCDLITFDASWNSRDESALESAVALYRGPLLAECDAPWIQADRTLRAERCLTALERLASQAAKHDHYADAIVYLRQALAQDPTRESAVCALMEALAAKRDYSAVTQTYRQFRSFLHDELQMEPGAETLALFQRLLAAGRHHDPSPVPVRTPEREISRNRPPRSGRRTGVRLPCPLTTLIGRETERQEIAVCLGACRLVTLTGAGGVGKTRLAIVVAEDVAEEYEDGIRFVGLADLSDPLLVPQAVAAVLSLHEEAGRPFTETIRDHLECRSVLLVLDNCEHLLTPCAALAEALLDGCPSLRILATSRVSLGIVGETIWRVPSLSLPTPARSASGSRNAALSERMHSDAVQLFVERAEAAERRFTLTDRNSQAVAQICGMLDGIPFAIELAAAWVRTLSVEQITSRLKDHLLPLANSSRVASPRQQTLRAMLDWSYSLLDSREMDLLRRLAVFAGGWTLEAVEAICLSAERSQADLVAVLAQLVDKSLVVVYTGPDEEIRYRLLETTREYAREQWTPDMQEDLCRRHAIYYRRLAGQAVHELSTKTSVSCQRNLIAQIDNVREARLWWQARDSDAAQEFTLELVQCGGVAYHSQEIRNWITQLDSSDTLVPSPFHTDLYLYLGRCAEWLGDVATGSRLWEKGLVMATHRDDRSRIAQAHRFLAFAATRRQEYAQAHRHYEASLANVQETETSAWTIEEIRIEYGQMALKQGDLSAAKRLFEQSLEKGRQCDDWRIVEDALYVLGSWAEAREEYTLAQSYWEERLQLLRRHAWEGHMPRTLIKIAAVVAHSGDFDTAWAYLEEALALCPAEPPDPSRGWIQFSRAKMALKQGRYAVANASLAESLAIFLELNEYGSLGHCLRGMAEFEVVQQRFEGAVCLLGNAAVMIVQYRWAVSRAERTQLDRLQSELQNILEPAVFQQAWARGAAMTLAQAVAFAEHSLANPLPSANPGEPIALHPRP